MFQGPSHNPEYLDRKLIVEPVAISERERSKAIANIVNNILSEAKKRELPEHEVVWKIGAALVNFCGIRNDVKHMSMLETTFRGLGKSVASVTDALKASFVEEEFAWLGRQSVDFNAPGNRVFEFSAPLRELLPIRDCNPTEALVLYTNYLEGKRGFWLKHYATTYGPSADAKMPTP